MNLLGASSNPVCRITSSKTCQEPQPQHSRPWQSHRRRIMLNFVSIRTSTRIGSNWEASSVVISVLYRAARAPFAIVWLALQWKWQFNCITCIFVVFGACFTPRWIPCDLLKGGLWEGFMRPDTCLKLQICKISNFTFYVLPCGLLSRSGTFPYIVETWWCCNTSCCTSTRLRRCDENVIRKIMMGIHAVSRVRPY